MLRHTLATLAYRAGKVLRDAPPEFQAFRPSEGGRSAGQILAHMGDLMDWSVSIVERREAWKDSNAPLRWLPRGPAGGRRSAGGRPARG